jgi:hypothetical protein
MPEEQEEGYMQQHLCCCMIDINDEKLTVVQRDETHPVPWPEILVLQNVHGEQAVYDIYPCALGPRETPAREKERLSLIYGREVVEQVYAGKAYRMEWFMPGWPVDPTRARKKAYPNARPPRVQTRPPPDTAEDTRI